MFIIGISGKKQSGKTTLANFIRAKSTLFGRDESSDSMSLVHLSDGDIRISVGEERGSIESLKMRGHGKNGLDGQQVKIFNFSDEMKIFCKRVLGLSYNQCYGSDEDKNTLTNYLWKNIPNEIRERYGTVDIDPSKQMSAREVIQVFGTDIIRNMFGKSVWVDATIREIHRYNPHVAILADVRFLSELESVLALENSVIIRLQRKKEKGTHASETQLDGYDFSQHGDRVLVLDNQDMTLQQQHELAWAYVEERIYDQ